MTALGMLLTGSGAVLIYAGIKGEDVRELLIGVLTGRRPTKAAPPAPAAPIPQAPPAVPVRITPP